MYLNFCSKNSK